MPTKPLSREAAQAAIDALNAAGGSITEGAKLLGIPRGTFNSRVMSAKAYGLTAAPKNVMGTSTLYGPDGEVKLQWVKEQANNRSPEQWAEYVKDVFSDITPVKRIPLPKGPHRKDLLTVYPIGDHHVAMYSWAEETGADYDIKIADNLLTSAMSYLVSQAAQSETAVIVNLGDFFHVDNLKNETSRSGNTLDVDTRYAAMIRAGVKMLRACVDTALEKHGQVKVISACGNHDDIGALWLSLALSLLYEKNPRVTIETGPGKFHYHKFGKVLLGVTHGDTGKPEKLSGVMAADRPELWGQTAFRYWLTGHVHNRKQLELPGVMWETFRTLAPADAWAHGAGYRAGRDMTSITFHAEHGEIGRSTFNVSMLEAA